MSASSLPAGYFDRLYAANSDPWDFENRWYEERKRAITLSSLPRPRFRSGFEPGCSVGLLTEHLAPRCDALVATDVASAAVETARRRLGDQPGVEIRQAQVPKDWPTEGAGSSASFDLIVMSEIAYYCNETEAGELGRLAARSLTGDGVLVLCHWLHPVDDYPLPGATAQRLVAQASGLSELARHEERDFLLQVLTGPDQRSVAEAEGLVR